MFFYLSSLGFKSLHRNSPIITHTNLLFHQGGMTCFTVCLAACLLAELNKYYWLELHDKNQWKSLGPTKIPLSFQGDLYQSLDTKKYIFSHLLISTYLGRCLRSLNDLVVFCFHTEYAVCDMYGSGEDNVFYTLWTHGHMPRVCSAPCGFKTTMSHMQINNSQRYKNIFVK